MNGSSAGDKIHGTWNMVISKGTIQSGAPRERFAAKSASQMMPWLDPSSA